MVIITQLNQILKPEHLEAGMYLEEESDDFIHLKRGNVRLATFGQRTTLEEIRKEADKHLPDERQKILV